MSDDTHDVSVPDFRTSEAPTTLIPVHGYDRGSDQWADRIDPPHYRDHPSGVECIDITEHMTFNLGNAVKYIWRQGRKPGTEALEDLRKARWYVDREIRRLEGLSGGRRGG